MKKCLSLVLALVMALGLLTVGGPAASAAGDKLDTPAIQLNDKTIIWYSQIKVLPLRHKFIKDLYGIQEDR